MINSKGFFAKGVGIDFPKALNVKNAKTKAKVTNNNV
jgi:hypothetical protein